MDSRIQVNRRTERDAALICTHINKGSYLPYTLNQTRQTSHQTHCILIWDKQLELDSNWEYETMNGIRCKRRDRLYTRLCWIEGNKHNPVKGRKEWLRFVLKRLFVMEELLRKEKIKDCWNFDSDTMIITELKTLQKILREADVDHTTHYDDKCPSGFRKRNCIEKHTSSKSSINENREFLKDQQKEFETLNSENAFTINRSRRELNSTPLSTIFINLEIWFDDCIWQEDEFETIWGERISHKIKNQYWNRERSKNNQKNADIQYKFVTESCTWTSGLVFQSHAKYQQGLSLKHKYIKDHLRFHKREKELNLISQLEGNILNAIFRRIAKCEDNSF